MPRSYRTHSGPHSNIPALSAVSTQRQQAPAHQEGRHHTDQDQRDAEADERRGGVAAGFHHHQVGLVAERVDERERDAGADQRQQQDRVQAGGVGDGQRDGGEDGCGGGVGHDVGQDGGADGDDEDDERGAAGGQRQDRRGDDVAEAALDDDDAEADGAGDDRQDVPVQGAHRRTRGQHTGDDHQGGAGDGDQLDGGQVECGGGDDGQQDEQRDPGLAGLRGLAGDLLPSPGTGHDGKRQVTRRSPS